MPPSNKGKGRGLLWLKAHVAHEGKDCLIWPQSRNYQGYGQLGYFGKVRKSHHIMCLLVNGPAPTPSHYAAHECGNGHLGCVHPKHVKWKTPTENRADTFRHGTNPTKVARRLTIDQVEEIRASPLSVVDLAKLYNVSFSAVFKIRRGETWVRPRSKLTLDKIKAIREAPEADCLKIGAALGANRQQVRKLRDGKTFQGVE